MKTNGLIVKAPRLIAELVNDVSGLRNTLHSERMKIWDISVPLKEAKTPTCRISNFLDSLDIQLLPIPPASSLRVGNRCILFWTRMPHGVPETVCQEHLCASRRFRTSDTWRWICLKIFCPGSSCETGINHAWRHRKWKLKLTSMNAQLFFVGNFTEMWQYV